MWCRLNDSLIGLRWNAMRFVHYGVNTYTDREWGEGTEDEKIF